MPESALLRHCIGKRQGIEARADECKREINKIWPIICSNHKKSLTLHSDLWLLRKKASGSDAAGAI